MSIILLRKEIFSSNSPAFLEEAFKKNRDNKIIVEEILGNNCCPVSVMWEVFKTGDDNLLAVLAKRYVIMPFGGLVTPEDEEYIRNRTATPEEILDKLADSENLTIVEKVAYNQTIPKKTMVRLATHDSEDVLSQLAQNNSITDDVAEILLERGMKKVTFALASNDKINPEVFKKILQNVESDIKLLEKLLYTAYLKIEHGEEEDSEDFKSQQNLWLTLRREVAEKIIPSNIGSLSSINFNHFPEEMIENLYKTTESLEVKKTLANSTNIPMSMVKEILKDVLNGDLDMMESDSIVFSLYSLFRAHAENLIESGGWDKASQLYTIIMESNETVLTKIVEDSDFADMGLSAKATVDIILRGMMLEKSECPPLFIEKIYEETKQNLFPQKLTSFSFKKNVLNAIASHSNAPVKILKEIEAQTNPNEEKHGSVEKAAAEDIIYYLVSNRSTPYSVLIGENFLKKITNERISDSYAYALTCHPEYNPKDVKNIIYSAPQILLGSILEKAEKPYSSLELEETEIVYLRLAAGRENS
jgi:nucleoside diphosphate kinase